MFYVILRFQKRKNGSATTCEHHNARKEEACFAALDFVSRYAFLFCPHPMEGKLGGRFG